MSILLMIDGFSSFSHSIAVDLFIASENTSQSILLVTLFLLSSKRVNKSRLVVKIVISFSFCPCRRIFLLNRLKSRIEFSLGASHST